MTRARATPLLLASAILLAVLPTVVQAQMACGPRDKVLTALEGEYGESQIGMGLVGSGTIFEMWVSEETGTWTFTRTTPNGITCIMSAGDNWINITPDYATPIGYPQPQGALP